MNAIDRFTAWRLRFKLRWKVDPNVLTILSVPLSMLVIVNAIVTLVVVLILDLLGGAVARGRRMVSERGKQLDWISDRLSELIIFGWFAVISPLIMLLPAANILINVAVARGAALYVLPLRQALLGVLIALCIIGQCALIPSIV